LREGGADRFGCGWDGVSGGYDVRHLWYGGIPMSGGLGVVSRLGMKEVALRFLLAFRSWYGLAWVYELPLIDLDKTQ